MEKIYLNNLPDANDLWKGIGGYFDSLGEILSEFIDNSISNFNANKSLVATIVIRFFDKGDKVRIRIEDSGTGIKDLESAFTIGSRNAIETVLNEHGFGFKHALASANPNNDDWSIKTHTKEDEKKGQYKEIKAPYLLNKLEIETIVGEWPGELGKTGTIFEFSCTKEMFRTIIRGAKGSYSKFDSILTLLQEDLGFTYAGMLKESLTNIRIIDSTESENNPTDQIVQAVEPVWEYSYGPGVGNEFIDLGNGKVKIEYHFGAIAENRNTSKYYKKNMASSGVEIRINGRLMEKNIVKSIWGIESHPSFNQFLGTVNLISNDPERLPKTKTSKNGLREGDVHLENLFAWIRSKIPNLPKSNEITRENQDERNLFEQLAKAKRTHLRGNPTVQLEMNAYNTLNEKIRMDLYISDGEDIIIYEGKKDKTTVKDLYQLIMYWDGCVFDGNQPTEGILISAEHPRSVKDIVKEVNSRQDAGGRNYNLCLKTWKEEGIEYPQ